MWGLRTPCLEVCSCVCSMSTVDIPVGEGQPQTPWDMAQVPTTVVGGGLQILPFPCVPTLLPWDESGQGCCSETPGNVANPRAPPPLSSHSLACLENPALPVTRAPGTGAGNIPVASTSFRLQGSHLSPGASSWTEVTASLRASYSCSFSNTFSRLQPER